MERAADYEPISNGHRLFWLFLTSGLVLLIVVMVCFFMTPLFTHS